MLPVNVSQPLSLWDRGVSLTTVMIEFSKNTPCLAQSVRLLFVLVTPKSFFNSLNILSNDGGLFTPSSTENDSP